MPSPSTAKRRGSMVRQLSLQNNLNSQSPAGRRGLKKQLSEDDKSRAAEQVGITGQGWSSGGEKPEAGLRVGSSEGTRTGQGKSTGARPRPVKLAWAERKQDSAESPSGVEVVARKCQGQLRPVTAKAQRVTNLPLLGDKDTLVYTRQQLAERLRRAWKEREKNRPNLDIFLAHGSETARSVNDDPLAERSVIVPQTEIVIRDSVSNSDSPSGSSGSSDRRTGDKRKPEPVRAVSQESHTVSFVPAPKIIAKVFGEPKGILKVTNSKGSKSPDRERRLQEQNKIEIRVSGCDSEPCGAEKNEASVKNPALADLLDFKTFPVADASKKFGSDFSGISFQMKSIEIPSKRNEAPVKIKHSRNKENMGSSMSESPRSDSSYSERSKIGKMDEGDGKMDVTKPQEPEPPPPMTAQARRASFRSSTLLHKTIGGSFSSPLPDSSGEFDDENGRDRNEIKVILTKNNGQRPPLTRTLSAPSGNEQNSPGNVQQSANQMKSIKFNNQQKRFLNQTVTSMDMTAIQNDDDASALRDRIKSAPTRRKLKTAASRRKNKEKGGDSSEDEKETKEQQSTTKKATRRRPVMKNAGDIVTMVSLVSPATSDTEDSVIHLPVEILTGEEKEESGQNSNSASSATGTEEPKDATSFIIQKFVSLRKTTKTVSFQQHPPINRSYSASFPSRRAPAGTPIIIPTPVASNPALTPAQLQEKRSQSSSGIISGTDNRGIKRRLIRTTSTSLKDDEASSDENSKTDTSTDPIFNRKKENGDEDDEEEEDEEEEEDPNKEPEFKSPKEKECWILYRKMLEKGVSVSYDTVLRGMLTPTEYRLRRNHLLSSC